MALILVIDDEQGVRTFARRTLELAGHSVLDAPDGRLGMRLFKSRHPDLVLTDILMPEREGLETIREIRAWKDRVPIIAMSGGGRTARLDFLDYAKELGADASLAKPFRPRDLVALVTELLKRFTESGA